MFDQGSNQKLFAADLTVLFDEGVRQALWEVPPSANFYASSPSNGALIDDPSRGIYVHRWGYVFDPRWGDVRHYDFAGDCTDWTTFPQGRLVSEYVARVLRVDPWLPTDSLGVFEPRCLRHPQKIIAHVPF